MTIRAKLYFAILLTVIGPVITIAVALHGMDRLGDRFNEVQDRSQRQALALDLKFDVTDFNGWQTAYGYDNGASRPRFESSVRRFRGDLATARKELTDARETRLLNDISARSADFMALDDVAYAALKRGDHARVKRIFLGPELRLFDAMAVPLGAARPLRGAPRDRHPGDLRRRARGLAPRPDRGGAGRGARDHPAARHGRGYRAAGAREPSRARMTDDIFLTLSLLLMGALLARFVASLLRIPEILLLVGVGALFGPSALDVVNVPFDSLGAQLIFTLGVSLILFYGGLSLSLPILRTVWLSLTLLAVPGVVITALIVGVTAHFVFDLPWNVAFLVGAVLSPTDPAILIPLFVRSRLKPKVAQTVIAESAFNDPTGAALALTFAGVVLTGNNSISGPAGEFLVDLGISTVIGIVAGVVLSAAISSDRMGVWRESEAIAVLAVITISFFSLDTAGGSGYLGAFLAGLIVGNARDLGLADKSQPHAEEVRQFAFNLADLVTLIVFMVLGANIPFAELGDNLLPALAVLATLMLVARPIVVLTCAMPDRAARWSRNELLFLCWTRETGVVPAALVGVLAGLGVPNGDVFASVVALAIVLTLLLQALPARWLAGRLGLLEPRTRPVAVESEAA